MNILTIIDSFKGTISSKELGKITTNKLSLNGFKSDYIAIADGGEGFLDAMMVNGDLKEKSVYVNDPLFRKIKAKYLVDNEKKIAYIELAVSSGISLLSQDELNPFKASTYGLGEVIKDAINNGYKKICLGIGGSATNDGGAGMLEALGVKFYNHDKLIEKVKNIDFPLITKIDTTDFELTINGIEFVVLSDVLNPLLGEKGATYVFSKQKGAKENELPFLEENMKKYSEFKKEYRENPGCGAAGGVGFAMHAYFNATFYAGLDYLLDLIQFDQIIKDYDYIITGEGKIDDQSLLGKVVFRIAERAKNNKIILVCAINEITEVTLENIKAVYSIVNDIVTREMSMNNPIYYYEKLVEQIIEDLKNE